ncbi:MAG: hypothetical protein WDW38_001776 [Sanguina aurantia]
MASDVTSKLLVVLATLLALLAVGWPYFDKSFSSSDKPCPLLYVGRSVKAQHAPMFTTPSHLSDPARARSPTKPEAPAAKAMLVDGKGAILVVGSLDQARAFALGVVPGSWQVPSEVREVDLRGGFVMPGLIDSHVHLLPGGLALGQAQLGKVVSREGFQSVVAESAARVQPGGWLLGGGWVEAGWGGALPDLAWIDEVCGELPAFLTRMDGHSALANSAALRAAGITGATPDPDHGHIEKDPSGQPTGLLRESAIQMVTRHIPEPTLETLGEALQLAIQHALSRGVTTLVDMGRFPFSSSDPQSAWRDLDLLLQPAADAGQLKACVVAFMPLSSWPRLASKIAVEGRGHPGGRLFWGGVKEFADGSLGSKTALMWEPYLTEPVLGAVDGGAVPGAASALGSQAGTRSIPMDDLAGKIRAADRAGLQVAIHAIGDRAVDEVIQAYEEALAASADPDPLARNHDEKNPRRHRVEHVQHISGPATIARMAAAGLLAVPNPLHMPGDVSNIEKLLGEERSRAGRSYALHSMTESLHTSFASDFPVVDLDLLESIYVAVHRKNSNREKKSRTGQSEQTEECVVDGWTMQESQL